MFNASTGKYIITQKLKYLPKSSSNISSINNQSYSYLPMTFPKQVTNNLLNIKNRFSSINNSQQEDLEQNPVLENTTTTYTQKTTSISSKTTSNQCINRTQETRKILENPFSLKDKDVNNLSIFPNDSTNQSEHNHNPAQILSMTGQLTPLTT